MDVRILGPLDVRVDGRAKAIGGPRPRAVLAVLALQAGRAVSAERLAAALWGEDAPPEAGKTVQGHVSRVRKALGDPSGALLATTPAGYRLVLGPEGLDAARFERAVTAARDVLTAGDADRAASMLRAALALWRGAPLEEFGWAPFAPAEIRRLEELRLAAVELRVEADLAAGRHSELIPELQRLTTDHPSRERLHGQLMVALYHSGRQAEALDAYRHARGVLVEQFGIEPGSGLREVHQAILVHDPVLDAEPAAGSARARRRGALPSLPNRTIGRAGDVRSVGARLCDDRLRLLTLTGPGGV